MSSNERRTEVAIDRILDFDVDSPGAEGGLSQLASNAKHVAHEFLELRDKAKSDKESWHFRAWRAAATWLMFWLMLMLVSEMINNRFPWSLLLPIACMATLVYLCPNTSQWHFHRYLEWSDPELEYFQCDDNLAPKSCRAFELSTGISLILACMAVLYALVEDIFPWVAVAFVAFDALCLVLLEIRIRYLLKKS